MLTKLKKQVQKMLTTEAKIACKIGFTPNRISMFGFILALASAATYAVTTAHSSWLLILATMVASFRVSVWAGALLVPYIVWVSIATYLNTGVWILNKSAKISLPSK